MVLGATSYGPSAGYPQHGYAHKEEYYKENSFKNGGYGHKEDYHKSDYYGGDSSSLQLTRPHSGIHSPSGPNHQAYGGHSHNTNRYGHDGSKYSSGGSYPQHGSLGGQGYGASQYGAAHGGGPSRFQDKYEYQHHGHNSSRPYYQQHGDNSHSWISKDLDD